jgi:ParB family chromosome partitioning protein
MMHERVKRRGGSPALYKVKRDSEAAKIGKLWRAACNSLVDSGKYYAACGERLIAKKATLKHGEWLPWLKANEDVLGFGRQTAFLLMKGAKVKLALHLDDEVAALAISRKLWGHDKVRGTQGTGDNEWYTPADVIAEVRAVLGAIDLDPASSEQAQRTVQALRYFTLSDDALNQPWHGTVYLNPPYAQPLIENFADRMIAEVSSSRVTSAIMLTHNYTDTAWFQKLAAVANAIAFPKGRIRFEAPDGTLGSPTQGQAFFYFGEGAAKFREVFGPLGFAVVLR